MVGAGSKCIWLGLNQYCCAWSLFYMDQIKPVLPCNMHVNFVQIYAVVPYTAHVLPDIVSVSDVMQHRLGQ